MQVECNSSALAGNATGLFLTLWSIDDTELFHRSEHPDDVLAYLPPAIAENTLRRNGEDLPCPTPDCDITADVVRLPMPRSFVRPGFGYGGRRLKKKMYFFFFV